MRSLRLKHVRKLGLWLVTPKKKIENSKRASTEVPTGAQQHSSFDVTCVKIEVFLLPLKKRFQKNKKKKNTHTQ